MVIVVKVSGKKTNEVYLHLSCISNIVVDTKSAQLQIWFDNNDANDTDDICNFEISGHQK